MRLILACLAALLLLIQYPLWLGKGGWLHVADMEKQVAAAQKKIDELKARNAKLASEVVDLKEGTGAVEERARYELGMIKENEVFVQVLDPKAVTAGAVNGPEGKPVDVKPAEAKSANAKPVNAKPASSKPVDGKAAQATRAEVKPAVASKPVRAVQP